MVRFRAFGPTTSTLLAKVGDTRPCPLTGSCSMFDTSGQGLADLRLLAGRRRTRHGLPRRARRHSTHWSGMRLAAHHRPLTWSHGLSRFHHMARHGRGRARWLLLGTRRRRRGRPRSLCGLGEHHTRRLTWRVRQDQMSHCRDHEKTRSGERSVHHVSHCQTPPYMPSECAGQDGHLCIGDHKHPSHRQYQRPDGEGRRKRDDSVSIPCDTGRRVFGCAARHPYV